MKFIDNLKVYSKCIVIHYFPASTIQDKECHRIEFVSSICDCNLKNGYRNEFNVWEKFETSGNI